MSRLLRLPLSLAGSPRSRRGKLLLVVLAVLMSLGAAVGLAGGFGSFGAVLPTMTSTQADTHTGAVSARRANRSPASATGDAGIRAAHARAVAAAARTVKVSRPVMAPAARERTADASHATALFAAHSWYVPPPPPPPVAPAPPPPPQAPPFPYTFVGSYAPVGAKPVYFLSRADRVIDAHVGDRLDGVYDFESAGSGGLVFNYLPLNIRQSVPTGVSP